MEAGRLLDFILGINCEDDRILFLFYVIQTLRMFCYEFSPPKNPIFSPQSTSSGRSYIGASSEQKYVKNS